MSFGTTQWSQVLTAREDSGDESSRRALERLCRAYWYPLYGYVRRKGYQRADAEDLTQSFFAQLVEKRRLDSVARDKGKFRTFLLTCLENFLCDEHDKQTALKRGGDRAILSLDWDLADSRYSLDARDDCSAGHYFEKKWAREILGRALERLRERYAESGQEELFSRLKDHLTGDARRGRLREISEELQMSEAAVRVAVSRLRKRYREALRAEVRETVASSADADAEFEHVCLVLTGG